ncbi:MAG: tyrosine-type recombinase/integrase [Clostridiales bacterium]|nr:tyrosine-type recombinase/integrase [Clostridiales bacterium]
MAKKRGNNEGSVYQRKDGRWAGAYSIGGKQKYIYGKTQDETIKKLREKLASVDKGEFVEPSAMKVSQWLNTWLQEYAKPHLRASTFASHESTVQRHLTPFLGNHKLQALRAEHIQAFINHQSHLAPATVTRQMAVLKTALKQAQENQLINRNPATFAKLPKQNPKEIVFLTAEEQIKVLHLLPMTTHGRAIRFTLGTGLRVSELAGLRWRDIEHGCIQIRQTCVLVKNKIFVGQPKTKAGRRTIPLNAKLNAILDQQKQTQRIERMKAGSAWVNNDYVFSSAVGTPMDRHNLGRSYSRILKEASLESRGLHTLRHTFATNWVQGGNDLRTLSELLGHSKVAFTMQIYVHSDMDTKKRGMDYMEGLL